MTIDLKNVAVKVEHQNPHDYCIISIGRLNDIEKNGLLNMFPTAIGSLQCRPTLPFASPMFQMTITTTLPIIPNFKICDSDVCNISIMDRMITSQTKLEDSSLLYEPNWFGSDSDDSETSNDENNSKEENKLHMTIELNNVAIKVQRQGKHECIISIGRLNDFEKNSLLNMFPLAIEGLQCKNPIHYTPLFEITVTVLLPNIPCVKICDSDACCLTITDRVITRIFQSKLTDSLCLANWFGGVDSVSNNGIKKVRLLYVAVKVDNKLGDCNCVRIGRIGKGEKEQLERILPPKMLNFKTRSIPNSSIEHYEIELCVPLTDIEDSNNCTIEVLYDENKPDMICISHQILFVEQCFAPWFDSDSDADSDDKVKCTRLTFVAVKVDNKRGKYKYIRIGRIGESEKTRLEQMLPSNMLNFKSRTTVTATRSFNYYELDLLAVLTTDIVDSNYCTIDISYDKRNPNVVSISDQRIIENHTTPQWFIPIAQRLSPPKVYETTQQMISQNKKEETNMTTFALERCIINDNATVLFWSDGTKTITKTTPGDAFDPEVGIAMGIAKRVFGSKHKFDKYVNAVVSDMYKRNAAAFTEKELLDALAENEKIITKAKAKHKAEKEVYLAAKNDLNHEGKLPVLHSLNGDHSYRFAKIRKDIIMAEIEKRKAKKAAKTSAKKKTDKK